MLKHSYLFTLLAAFLLVFSSCSDDDNNDPAPHVDATHLQKHVWLMTEHMVKATGEEDYNVLEDYEGDKVTTEYQADKEFVIKVEGEEAFNGTYEVKKNQLVWECPISVLGQTLGGSDVAFDIKELTSTTLKLEYSVTMDNMTITEIMTLKAQ